MSRNDGGPAFPQEVPVMGPHPTINGALEQIGIQYVPGMSLRAYFAAHAPIGIEHVAIPNKDYDAIHSGPVLKALAEMRVKYADALLAALEKKV